MKALPLEQAHLVELQGLDLSLARVQHQLRSHPLHATIEQLRGRADDLRIAAVAFGADLDAKNRQIQGIEEETEKVRVRHNLQQERLEQGKVPLRDMTALQHEIAQIATRISTLENELLEAMGEAETIEAKIVAADTSRAAIAAELAETEAALSSAAGDIQGEQNRLLERRAQVVELLPAALVAEYGRLQQRLGVNVVIEVRDGRPLASPVDFSMAELAEIASIPSDQLYFTDDDEYMVVRTTS